MRALVDAKLQPPHALLTSPARSPPPPRPPREAPSAPAPGQDGAPRAEHKAERWWVAGTGPARTFAGERDDVPGISSLSAEWWLWTAPYVLVVRTGGPSTSAEEQLEALSLAVRRDIAEILSRCEMWWRCGLDVAQLWPRCGRYVTLGRDLDTRPRRG